MTQLIARYPGLVSPFALACVAAVAALVASVLLGVQDASAGIVVHRRH
jgi:hypothetical protein